MKYDEFVAFYLFWRSALNSKRHLIKDKKTHYPLIKIIKEPEAVAQWCSVKKVFLEILQDSQENTCATGCRFKSIQRRTMSYRR